MPSGRVSAKPLPLLRHLGRRVLVLVIVLQFCVLTPHASAISIQQEEELAAEFLKVLNARFEIIDDPLITAYVERIGRRVLDAFPPQPFAYHFYVIREEVFNAFAIPAGHIFIHSGLLAAMESEDELAGILSHEIAHAASRHISQKIERSKKINLVTLAGLAAGIFLGAGGASTAANAVSAGSLAAGQSLSLAYSREDEIQADQLGLVYLHKAGYDGAALLRVLKKMREQQWFDAKQIPTYLTTHPATEDRIVYIDTWLSTHPATEAAQRPSAPATRGIDPFTRTRTRLMALYGDEQVMLRLFGNAAAAPQAPPAARYGYGLILVRGGKRKEAIEQYRQALEQNALDAGILTELGRAYFLDGSYPEALNTLEGAVSLTTENTDALFYLARTQMEVGRHADAVVALEALLAQNSHFTQAYYFLGEAYGRIGRMGRAHYNLGLYYTEKGNRKNALFHLNKARQETQDPALGETLDALLKKAERLPTPTSGQGNRTP